MKVIRPCIFFLLTAAVLSGCVKLTGPEPSPAIPEIEDTTAESISFDFSVKSMDDLNGTGAGAGTKALVTSAGFMADGNQIKVYDIFKGQEGSSEYFNTVLTSNGSGWATPAGQDYKWTRTGTHNFFGWFLKDASGSDTDFTSLFGNESYSNYTLTLPAIEMTASTPQFDFLYSDILAVGRTPSNSTAEPISLSMKHLFTAFSLSARNDSDSQTITITKVEVRNLANKKSATLTFNATGQNSTITPVFSTASDAHTTTPDFSYAGEITLQPSSSIDNLLSTASNVEYLMWPQTAEDLRNAKIYIEYERNGVVQEPTEFPIPQGSWDSGKINKVEIVFTTQAVKLVMSDIRVNEGQFAMTFSWDEVEHANGYSIRVINENTHSVVQDWTTTDKTSYRIDGLNNNNQQRTIYVKALGDGVNYLTSDEKSQTGTTSEGKREKLETPTITKFEKGTNSLTVAWEKISMNCQYEAKIFVWQNDDWSQCDTRTTSWETEFVFWNLDMSKDYKVELVAKTYDATNYADSDPAIRTTRESSSPTKLVMGNITCTERGLDYLSFSWNAVNGAQSYEVGKDNGSGGKEWMNIGNSTSFRWEGREQGTSYTIYVRAIGDGTNYLTSDEKSQVGTTLKKVILWENNSTYGGPFGFAASDNYQHASGRPAYRFGSNNAGNPVDCMYIFNDNDWAVLKNGTFYVELSGSSFSFHIMTGWWDGNGQGQTFNNNNTTRIDNDTYYVAINISNYNSTVWENMDEHDLLFFGNVKLNCIYYYQ